MVQRRAGHQAPISIEQPVLLFLILVFAVMVVRTAWIGDDAYITLRTVDNFVRGYGLTWNVAERVWTYTHPLWMLALSSLYAFTREPYYTTLLLSVAVSVFAYYLVMVSSPRGSLASVAVLSVLVLSNAFMEYSTSGLENPASHLLMAAFLLIFMKLDRLPRPGQVLQLGILAGLAALNRMDTLLLYLPALVYVWWQRRSWSTARMILLGFLPFVVWEVFAIVYYGFPFPNSAYAKLNTGLARLDLLEQGWLYFLHSLHWDPITLTIIFAAAVAVLVGGDWTERIVVSGIGLYLFYVLWIGGDFMTGRYFSTPLLGAVVLLSRRVANVSLAGGALILVIVIGLARLSPAPTLTSLERADFPPALLDEGGAGIVDERAVYISQSGLLNDRRDTTPGVLDGLALRESKSTVEPMWAVGFGGYFAGPEVHIVDMLGVCDPLLARIRPITGPDWRIGHLERPVPEAYFRSLEANRNLLQDPDLALYYDKIRLVTRGPLWSAKRFAAIWDLNTAGLPEWPR